jgi:hypothetical protein
LSPPARIPANKVVARPKSALPIRSSTVGDGGESIQSWYLNHEEIYSPASACVRACAACCGFGCGPSCSG